MSRSVWTLSLASVSGALGTQGRAGNIEASPEAAQQMLADATSAGVTRALVVGGLAFALIVVLAFVVVYRTAKAKWHQQTEERDGHRHRNR